MAAAVCVVLGFPFTRLKGIYFTVVSIFVVQVIVLIVLQWPASPAARAVFRVFLGRFVSRSSLPLEDLVLFPFPRDDAGLTAHPLAIEHSRIGLTFQGIKQAGSLAESVGINTTTYKWLPSLSAVSSPA